MFDPPKQPDWSEMTVEILKELTQRHRETSTVNKFLCKIDIDSNFYDGSYCEIDREDIPSNSRFGSK